MRTLIAALFVLALTGCLTPQARTGWVPLACDDPQSNTRSLIQGMVVQPRPNDEVARRLGQAVEDPVAGHYRVERDYTRVWPTQAGQIRETVSLDKASLLTYEGRRTWPADSETTGMISLQRVASLLQMPEPYKVRYRAEGGEGTIWQIAGEGLEVAGTSSILTWIPRDENGHPFVRFVWRNFAILPDGDVLSTDEAKRKAETFSRCLLDAEGRTADRGYELQGSGLLWNILHELDGSPYYVVHVKHSHPHPGLCPSAEVEPLVYIDAWTGAVLQYDWNVCARPA